MHYHDVVAALRDFTRVIVTGPQRSGTTIAARILAAELGLPCLLEEAFGTVNVASFFRLLDSEPRFVLQAPSMAALCHYVESAAVVFMIRDVADIIRSQERVGWDVHEAFERERYFVEAAVPAAALKYSVWCRFQKQRLGSRAFELDYESLREHPLWVEPQLRANFHARQTVVEATSLS